MIACLRNGRSVQNYANYASEALRRELDGAQRVFAMSLRKTSRPSLGLTWNASMATYACKKK